MGVGEKGRCPVEGGVGFQMIFFHSVVYQIPFVFFCRGVGALDIRESKGDKRARIIMWYVLWGEISFCCPPPFFLTSSP